MFIHVFTTTFDTWLLEGLCCALRKQDVDVQVTSVASAGALLNLSGNRLPDGALLLPVFPDNQPATCLCSLSFLLEWRDLQTGLFHYRAPCALWGQSPFIRALPASGRIPVIPWRATPAQLGSQIVQGMLRWQRRPARRTAGIARPTMLLSPREVVVLRHTLSGRSLGWIAEELGVSSKTVWTHRRRAMDVLGVRRLHELMQFPASALCGAG